MFLRPNYSRQSLYDNEQQIQDHFAMFWEMVAQKFQDNKYVLGYELLNEPWAGDVYRHPDQLEPRMSPRTAVSTCARDCVCVCVPLDIADARNLAPMYKKLHDSIRKYDQKHIILFEPTTIITSVRQHLYYTL